MDHWLGPLALMTTCNPIVSSNPHLRVVYTADDFLNSGGWRWPLTVRTVQNCDGTYSVLHARNVDRIFPRRRGQLLFAPFGWRIRLVPWVDGGWSKGT